eukprot:gene13737-4017_t
MTAAHFIITQVDPLVFAAMFKAVINAKPTPKFKVSMTPNKQKGQEDTEDESDVQANEGVDDLVNAENSMNVTVNTLAEP